MKRRIAVFANGWNNLGIVQALKGIQKVTEELNIDIFLFLSFAAFGHQKSRNQGEDSIFYLSDYKTLTVPLSFQTCLTRKKIPRI